MTTLERLLTEAATALGRHVAARRAADLAYTVQKASDDEARAYEELGRRIEEQSVASWLEWYGERFAEIEQRAGWFREVEGTGASLSQRLQHAHDQMHRRASGVIEEFDVRADTGRQLVLTARFKAARMLLRTRHQYGTPGFLASLQIVIEAVKETENSEKIEKEVRP